MQTDLKTSIPLRFYLWVIFCFALFVYFLTTEMTVLGCLLYGLLFPLILYLIIERHSCIIKINNEEIKIIYLGLKSQRFFLNKQIKSISYEDGRFEFNIVESFWSFDKLNVSFNLGENTCDETILISVKEEDIERLKETLSKINSA